MSTFWICDGDDGAVRSPSIDLRIAQSAIPAGPASAAITAAFREEKLTASTDWKANANSISAISTIQNSGNTTANSARLWPPSDVLRDPALERACRISPLVRHGDL